MAIAQAASVPRAKALTDPEWILQQSTVTKSSLRKAMGAIKHEDNVCRKMYSQPKPPKLAQSEIPWLK